MLRAALIRFTIAAAVLLGFLIVLGTWGIAPIVWTCTLVAFAASGYFITTWGWNILQAKSDEPITVTWLGMLDFAGLQVMVFLYTGLALVDIVENGVPPAPDWNGLIRRTILYLLITLIALLRAVRWIKEQHRTGAPVVFRRARGASSDHNDALEGSDERDPAGHP